MGNGVFVSGTYFDGYWKSNTTGEQWTAPVAEEIIGPTTVQPHCPLPPPGCSIEKG